MSEPLAGVIHFGVFDFDVVQKELRKSGTRVKLDRQAAELLALLLEKPGKLITYDEIKERIWAADTHVDFGKGIRRCLNLIRDALGDDAQHPIYIETRKTRGCCFVAPVSSLLPDGVDADNESISGVFTEALQTAAPTPLPREKLSSFLHRGRQPIFAGALLTMLSALLVKATLAAAYGFAIGTVCILAIFFVVISANTDVRSAVAVRVASALVIIAAMSYIASASTLPYVMASVVNMTTLKPAAVYPFVTGLKFIPLFVLVLTFWVLLVFFDDKGFRSNRTLGKVYTVLGIGFLLADAISIARGSADYQIWAARVSGYWSLIAGYVFILAVNLAVWLVGYRLFKTDSTASYRQLIPFCAVIYLPLALAAAFVDQQYNHINRSFLDKRRPEVYRVGNPGAIKNLEPFKNALGQDLIALLKDPQFEQALRTEKFYKQNFDEPFQVLDKAVMFGYKLQSRPPGRPAFVIIRFPQELAAALRFQSLGELN